MNEYIYMLRAEKRAHLYPKRKVDTNKHMLGECVCRCCCCCSTQQPKRFAYFTRIHTFAFTWFELQLLMLNSSMVDLQHFMSNANQNKSITTHSPENEKKHNSFVIVIICHKTEWTSKVLIHNYQIDKVLYFVWYCCSCVFFCRSSGTNIQLIHDIWIAGILPCSRHTF